MAIGSHSYLEKEIILAKFLGCWDMVDFIRLFKLYRRSVSDEKSEFYDGLPQLLALQAWFLVDPRRPCLIFLTDVIHD